VLRGYVEGIVLEDHEIRQLPGFYRALVVLFE